MSDKNITKYLQHYAEEEAKSLSTYPGSQLYEHVVVIPAYKESFEFIHRFFASVLARQSALLIIVINQPKSAEIDKQKELFNQCEHYFSKSWQHNNISLYHLDSRYKIVEDTSEVKARLMIIDRYNYPIPEKQGVGLARKIGADIALSLIDKKIISSEWIYSTDADVTLPDNYFDAEQTLKNKNCAAGNFEFYHQSDNHKVDKANQQYERALRYFQAGLKYANSPYAFFTIGSILIFNAKYYAQVRGFPKRSAGEDFYLLNKLAKLATIEALSDITLKISARTSDRVPFGTGPAVNDILLLEQAHKEYCYYHPALFKQLKLCIESFDSLWDIMVKLGSEQGSEYWFKQQKASIACGLKSIGFSTFLAKQANSVQSAHNISSRGRDTDKQQSQKQFYKQLHVWFDAFKTLKFIHALRENEHPNLALTQAIKLAEFTFDNGAKRQ